MCKQHNIFICSTERKIKMRGSLLDQLAVINVGQVCCPCCGNKPCVYAYNSDHQSAANL